MRVILQQWNEEETWGKIVFISVSCFVAAALCGFYAFLITKVCWGAEFSVGSGENCSKLGATDSHSELYVRGVGWQKMRPQFPHHATTTTTTKVSSTLPGPMFAMCGGKTAALTTLCAAMEPEPELEPEKHDEKRGKLWRPEQRKDCG